MERNGDVATEFNSCHSENFCLNTSLFETECDKMCKDDNSESLFCKMSGKMRSDNVLTSGFEAQHEISISELKNQCLGKLGRPESDFVNNDEHALSMIQQKTENAMNNHLLPIWEKSSKLCAESVNPKPRNVLLSDDSFVNGKKIMNDTEKSFLINNNCLNSSAINNSDSSLGATSDSFQQTCVEELSSSSIEELFVSSPKASSFNQVKEKYIACSESKNLLGNISSEKNSSFINAQTSSSNLSSLPFAIPKLEIVKEIESSPKNEMPELIPTICLDDDDDSDNDESIPFTEKKSCENANVADSPEMPKLVPFSTDIEDIIKIKMERLDDDETHKNDCFQLRTSAKRKLFLQCDTDCAISVKKSKSVDVKLEDYTNKRNSPVNFTMDDSISYLSQTADSGSEKSLHEEDQQFENSDFHNFLSQINRDLKQMNEKTRKSEDIESQNSFTPSNQSQVRLRKLSLENCLPNGSDKQAFDGTSVIEEGEIESKFSFKHCLPSNDSDDNDSLASKPECQDIKNSSSEGPEIEEIEGVRFFQFRSKHAMEEFHKIPPDMEMDIEMIVPTKTTDITQIKGWRNKFFAPESQFQLSGAKSESNIDECSENAVSLPPLEEDNNCVDFGSVDNDVKSVSSQENKNLDVKCLVNGCQSSSDVIANASIKSDADEKNLFYSEILNNSPVKSDTEEKDKKNSIETEKSEELIPDDPMSAFISKKLDHFLLNSSTLNVDFLQKTNPNIKPISPDAPILSIGKLKKIDQSNVPCKTKFFYKVRDDKDKQILPALTTKSTSAPVITLSSSEESSSDDDNIPVAVLYSKVNQTKSRPSRFQPNKCIIRRTSDSSADHASQRVVLRLTKQSRSATDGYKVSDIVEKQEPDKSFSNLECEETLPDVFKTPTDGSLSTIKDGIFLKESEPKLLEEFLNNLNMYGTSNGVAMLVQSNQSYFVKGPVLTTDDCGEALDALVSNKEFLDLKSKPTPKKKLKTWQKYLPKKLSKTQQQQISNKASQQKNAVANLDSSEKKLIAKEQIKQAKLEEQQSGNKSSLPQKSGLVKSKNFEKMPDSKDKISQLDEKSKFANNQKTAGLKKNMKSKHLILQKKREIRRKSKLNIDAQLALIERGKRSIRLPARYLDSAVLAAGSEWVSPIFIEDEKKTRKQLLDVLDKITPNKETNNPIEKKTANVSNHSAKKKNFDSTLKQISKESSASKKQKGDQLKQNIEAPKYTEKRNEAVDSKSTDEDAPVKEIMYPLPLCECSPCSRTASFDKEKKLFLCFSEHNKKENDVHEKNNHKSMIISCEENAQLSTDGHEITISKVVDEDKSLRKELEINSVDYESKNVKPCDSLTPQSNQTINSTPKYTISSPAIISTPTLKNALSNTTMKVATENHRSLSPTLAKLLYTTSTNLLRPNVSDGISNESSSSPVLNIPANELNNKVLLFVPPISSTPKNTSVPILSNPLCIQKIQKFVPEVRSKPPILARKTAFENQTTFVPSPVSSLSNNALNQTSVLLKLPKVTQNADNCVSFLYGPQITPVIKGSGLSNAPSVLGGPDNSNLLSNVSQQKMAVMKGFKLGNKFFLCPPETKSTVNANLSVATNGSGQNQVSPTVLGLLSPEISVNNNKVPILQTSLKTDSLSSDEPQTSVSAETNVDSKLKSPLVSRKTSGEVVEDLHNYHRRQSSERRRKSPLSKRKFKDNSDSDIDVDTIDQDFDASLSLKQYNNTESDTEASDNVSTVNFLSDLSTLLSPHKRKTINERNRRQLISNLSDKLRNTSKFFQNAKSLSEILDRASVAVRYLTMQNQSRIVAKKILQYRNAQLLEKLSNHIQNIPDAKCRTFVKKKIIQTTAHAWKRDRQHKKRISSPLLSTDSDPSVSLETNSSSKQDFSLNDLQEDIVTTLDSEESFKMSDDKKYHLNILSSKESEACENKEVTVNASLNSETMELLQTHINFGEHYVMETDVIEQPHVQLRILEAPVSCEETETNILIKEKEIETPSNENSPKEAPPVLSSVQKARKRLQLRGSCDANTSDDDHLVIDLSDDNTYPEEESLPQKDVMFSAPATPAKTAVEGTPIKKFPGLIPLYATDFLQDENELETAKPHLISQAKCPDSGADEESSVCNVNQMIVTKRTSVPGLMSLLPGTHFFSLNDSLK